MRKIVSLLTVLMLLCTLAFAQQRTVTGQVRDANGAPVPFATVTEVGNTRNAVKADENGNFTIKVADNARLSVSAAGFTAQTVNSANAASISMARTEGALEEVIVTAQGIRRRPKELGYAATKVTNEEVTVGHSPQLGQALSGKVSGLAVYNVDNSVDPQTKIVLRGYRSLTGNNNALIVIDGVPFVSPTVNPLSALNPNDIESVSILKGGQAATLYGSQGVNGAVVITTKRGTKGKATVTYTGSFNAENISFLPSFQEQYGNGSHYTTFYGQPGYLTDYKARMKENWRPFENQQYGDAYNGEMRIIGRVTEDGDKLIAPYAAIPGERRRAWNTGFTINNQVAVSGGDATSTFYLSGENNDTRGIVPGDKSNRTSFRLAATKDMNKFKAGFNVAYVQANYDRTTSDFYFDMINVAAHVPISQLRDWRNNKFASPNGFYDDYYNNPYFNADNNRAKYQDANINGNLDLSYQLLSWLSLNDKASVYNNTRNRKEFTGKFIYSDWAKNSAYVPAPWDWANDYDGIDRASSDILGGVLDRSTSENIVNNDFQIHLNRTFGDFKNTLILGQNIYQRKTKQIEVSSGSIVQPDLYNVSNRQGNLGGGESNSLERKWGYYADLTTGWKDMLFAHGSFRYDASSRFYADGRDISQYAYPYYGVDVSAILTDIVPSIKNNILSYAKLRLAYNHTGNDNLDPYSLDLQYLNASGFPYGNTVGYTVGNVIPDKSLHPEYVNSIEGGGEFQFLNSRISLEANVYKQKSIDQILTVKIPNSSGFSNARLNVATSENWGWESDLRVQVIKKAKLNWDLSARFSYNDNKVLSLYQGVDQFAYGGYAYAQTYVISGQSFPQLKATAYVKDPATGRVLVNKTSGYPILNATDLVQFGRTTPPYIAGLGTRLRVGDFTLTANAEYRGGNVMFTDLGRQMTFSGSGGWTADRTPHIFPNSAYDDGTGKIVPNNDVFVREAEYSLWVDYYRKISENFVTPGWFIKLRDVNLSYALPGNLVTKTRVLSAATISVYGRNLVTIVDKKNVFTDPEFSYTTTNGQGINNTGNTPPVRQYGVSLNLTF